VGHFVVTFPGAFHQGYNTGSNIFEARNFESRDWRDWAKKTLVLPYCAGCKANKLHDMLDVLMRKEVRLILLFFLRF
jgi:hypothetical protein